MMDYVNAFWVGGLICALAQILLDRTKMMPGRIMVLLVCTGAALSFLGIYEPFFRFAGAGASVPESGFLGLFQGGFRAGAVGCSAALIFGYLASLIFRPRMKK